MGPRVLKDDASSQFLPKSCGTRPLQGGQGWTRTVAGQGDSQDSPGRGVGIGKAGGQAGWSGPKFFCESQKTSQRGLWAPQGIPIASPQEYEL